MLVMSSDIYMHFEAGLHMSRWPQISFVSALVSVKNYEKSFVRQFEKA